MSSQPPWSPGQPGPVGPPPSGYGPAPGYGPPQGHVPPQAYGPAQGQWMVQPYPAPQREGYGPGPTGELVINLRKPFGAMGMISPVVTIDGYPAPAGWGRNAFPAPAGVRQVDVAQTYLWTYGRASLAVPVQPGVTSEIFYSGPMATLGFGGALGTEPQKRPGTWMFIAIVAFVALVLVISLLGVAVGSS